MDKCIKAIGRAYKNVEKYGKTLWIKCEEIIRLGSVRGKLGIIKYLYIGYPHKKVKIIHIFSY